MSVVARPGCLEFWLCGEGGYDCDVQVEVCTVYGEHEVHAVVIVVGAGGEVLFVLATEV